MAHTILISDMSVKRVVTRVVTTTVAVAESNLTVQMKRVEATIYSALAEVAVERTD